MSVSKKVGLKENLRTWIQSVTKNEESCLINFDKTTQYFTFQRTARQGSPISSYLIVIPLEIFILFHKKL